MHRNGAIHGTAYDLRAETVDYFVADRSWEIAGWSRLARRYGRRVVEWICGTGEVACGLARRGLDVIGVDLGPEMLAVAEQRAEALPAEMQPVWIQDDVRDAALPRRENDLAIIATHSFNHLVEVQDQIDALRSIRRHLRPGGALAMALKPASKESRAEQTGIFGPSRSTPDGVQVRKVVRNQYDADSQLLEIHDKVEVIRGDRQRIFEYRFSMRLFTPDQITRLLTQAGFAGVGMFGDYDWKPWHEDAPEWIVCAERPLN
jgi:ubiquinone/menaquinone biosynthesis C-methylase UbiE